MKRAAVFLDRDGTIIEDPGYIHSPEQVRLLPGAARAIQRLSEAGFFIVIASNQSGIARGLFDEKDLSDVHTRLEELLEAEGASLDGAYYCPYLDGPDASVDAYKCQSELRKPRPGMLLQAAREMNIELDRSWMIGDSITDVEAGSAAGCKTILIEPGGQRDSMSEHTATAASTSLFEAAEVVERSMKESAKDNTSHDVKSRDNEIVTLLSRIHDVLDYSHRQHRQHDFSLLRLAGALLQMLAVVVGLWGTAGLLGDQWAPATARFSMACFLQLASISAFAIDRFR